MTFETKISFRRSRLFLAFCIGSGFSSMLSAQAPVSSDGWQARNSDGSLLSGRELPRSSVVALPTTNELQHFVSGNAQTRLAAPQPAAPSLNWMPPGQIPASPWQRTKGVLPVGSEPMPRSQKGETEASLPLRSELPERMIRQPITSASTSRTIPARPIPKSAQMIEQPQHSRGSWESMPERGQVVQFDEQRPIVDLGLPVPADSAVSTPTRENFSGQAELPLEAQREQRSSASDGTRRATRSPEPHSKEVGHVDSMDYLSGSPSTVVGVVAMPGVQNRYAEPSSDHSMNTFVPSHDTVSHVVPASMAENEAMTSRMRLASQVSRELLSGSQQPLGVAPLPIEPPTGWKNVESELRDHLVKCDELLRRNAILSAREEVLMGLRVLFRAIDLRSGEWVSEPALDQALAAFSEESDFHQSLRNPTRGQPTARIVAGHATQALKQVDLASVSPELAAQYYRAYARQQLAKAAQGHPWAADLFYAFGKTYERRADSSKEDGFMFHNQAVTCFSAALDVVPHHVDGANQLGFTLMKLDRIDEAQAILSHATQTSPSSDTWKNLAEVYRRRGQMDQVAIAVQQATALETPTEANKVPEVFQVDPQTFIGMSPNQFMNPTIANVGPAATATATHPAPPTKSPSWFSRLIR